jgi:predicted HicB family RNase H-like nuclease
MNDCTEIAEQRGRPVSLRVPEELARQIEACAARELISVAAFCRRAVARDIAAQRAGEAA